MPRLVTRPAPGAALTAAAGLALVAPLLALAPSVSAAQPAGYGPSDPFDDALTATDGPVEPMKNQAKIERTRYGYRYVAGQQNSNLTVSLGQGKLRFHDVGTRSWRSLPYGCTNRPARGVAAACTLPGGSSASSPMLLEVHPRLGSDRVDGRTLPAAVDMAVLADAGADTVLTGAGDDFVNGAKNRDRIHGGAGNDWIRGGLSGDRLRGQGGNDYIVGQAGRDSIRGGTGTDRIYR